jgi:hypothetical protein
VSGSPPVPVASVDQPKYRRGGQVRARVDITDPDNRVATMSADGTGPAGEAMHLDQRVTYSDIPKVLWRYQGTTATLGTGLTLTLLAPARSVVLEAVVTDAQGHTVVTSVPVTVQSLALGLDMQGTKTTLADLDTAFAAWPAFSGPSKLFWSDGAGPPTWTGKAAHLPKTAIPHLAYFDTLTVAQIVALLDAMPATVPQVWLSPHQEGDRTMTPAAFRAGFGPLLQAVAGHPARLAGRVRIVVNLTEYWQRTKNNNGYGAFIPDGLDPELDLLGADCYPGGQTGYTPAATVLAGPVAAGKASGLQVVAPEFALVVPASPTAADLDARAGWYRDFLDEGDAAGVLAAGAWLADGKQAVGTGGFIPAAGDPVRDVLTDWLMA